jgi:hypothetical protein
MPEQQPKLNSKLNPALPEQQTAGHGSIRFTDLFVKIHFTDLFVNTFYRSILQYLFSKKHLLGRRPLVLLGRVRHMVAGSWEARRRSLARVRVESLARSPCPFARIPLFSTRRYTCNGVLRIPLFTPMMPQRRPRITSAPSPVCHNGT